MRYWDSCAIVPLCLHDDAFSENMSGLVSNDDSMATWWGSQVECCSAFARVRREGIISSDEEQQSRARLTVLASAWTEVEPSEKVKALAKQLLLRQSLRAADSLQLAAAIVWANGEPDNRAFVTLDKRLREAAKSEGFSVLPYQQVFEAMIGTP